MNKTANVESSVSATRTNGDESDVQIKLGIVVGVLVIVGILIFLIR